MEPPSASFAEMAVQTCSFGTCCWKIASQRKAWNLALGLCLFSSCTPCCRWSECCKLYTFMAHTFFQQMEAVPSGFLALGGKHYDSFMFSFKAPAIGKKLPYFQVAAQMEHPMVLPQHLAFTIGFLEFVQGIFNGLPQFTSECMRTSYARKTDVDANTCNSCTVAA